MRGSVFELLIRGREVPAGWGWKGVLTAKKVSERVRSIE